MRRLLLCSALVCATVAPAYAETAPLPTGTGCGYNSVGDGALGEDTYRAVVSSGPVAAAALPPTDALANPVAITVTCTLHVFGYGSTPDPAIEVSASGTAVAVVAPTVVTYTAADEDWAAVCTKATLTDANGATHTYYLSDDNDMWYSRDFGCDGFKCLALGPDCDYTLALVAWVFDHLQGFPDDGPDDEVCPVLAALAPGVPGVVDIDPTGDTYAGGEFLWDCPPYSGS